MQSNHDLHELLRPRLEVRHLSLLVAIAEAGSVTGAAALLGLSQPALSRQIREAERRLGQTLYAREKNRLRPTLAGECLLENARRILRDLSQAESDSIQIPAAPRQAVRIGCGAYSSYAWLPGFVGTLQRQAPTLEITVAGETARPPQEALLQEAIDLAILPGPLESRGLRVVSLFTDELVAVLPTSHRLAQRSVIEAEDFAAECYLTYGPTYQKGFETDRLLRPAKIWPQRLIKIELVDAILEMVAAGLGVSVLSRWAVDAHRRRADLAAIRLTDQGLPISWRAALRRADGERSPAARVAELLASWCQGEATAFASVGG